MTRAFRVLMVATALAALALAGGCGGSTRVASPEGPLTALELEYEAVDLALGATKDVKVLSGTATAVQAPHGSGLTATVQGDKIVVAASKSARKGRHVVVVKSKGMEATFTVTLGMVPALKK